MSERESGGRGGEESDAGEPEEGQRGERDSRDTLAREQKAQRLRKKGRAAREESSRGFSLREDHRPSYVLLSVTLHPPTSRRVSLPSVLRPIVVLIPPSLPSSSLSFNIYLSIYLGRACEHRRLSYEQRESPSRGAS